MGIMHNKAEKNYATCQYPKKRAGIISSFYNVK